MSSFQTSAETSPPTGFAQAMREHSGVFLAEGIILILLGFAAIIVPPLAGLAATIFLVWLFLIAGIAGLVTTFRARHVPGFGWSLLSAVVAIFAGLVLLWHPLAGLVTLTYVLIAYFFVDGIITIGLAVAHRSELSGKWEWMLVNGIIDIVLAAIILSGLPGSFVWALGLLVGIDMFFGGATLVAMALNAPKPAAA